jgi:hypothetical protein
VRLQSYLSMPHNFQVFDTHPSIATAFRECVQFIQDVTTGRTVETEMKAVNEKGVIEQTPLDLEKYPVTATKEEVHLKFDTSNSS